MTEIHTTHEEPYSLKDHPREGKAYEVENRDLQ